MSQTTIYIAGAVSAIGIEKAEPLFRQKEQELTAQGFRVLNPVKLTLQHGYQNRPWREIMQFLLPFVACCDILYILKGWEDSKGTNVERDLCLGIGTEIRYEDAESTKGNHVQAVFNEHISWADAQFGNDRPQQALEHLKRECSEAQDNLGDVSEFADMQMLLWHSFHCAHPDKTLQNLTDAVYDKLQINKGRKWGLPDKDGVIEHIRN